MSDKQNLSVIFERGAITECKSKRELAMKSYLFFLCAGLLAWFVIAPVMQIVIFFIMNFLTGKKVPLW